MNSVRPPAVAGAFYPSDPSVLASGIEEYLSAARGGGRAPKALIAPHAGYVYSGPVAASAYARLRGRASKPRRVLLLGPAHRLALRGVALPSARAFRTPLGEVPLDMEALRRMEKSPNVRFLDSAHEEEHCLEVQLPFLQVLLGDFLLLPLLVGEADPARVESLLAQYAGGPETLIIVSSDLSHYLPYEEAVRLDAATARAVERLETEGWTWDCACGRVPILGLLRLARSLNMEVETLDLRNSGDTAGGKDRVVGYGAWAFHLREEKA